MPTETRRTFISYSRVNKEFAIKLAKELRSDGISIWFDQLDIPTGSRWDDELEKALHECGVFLVILTPDSIASENVKDEIGFAIDNNKRILPLLLENCNVPLRLRRFQYVDFTTKSYDEGVQSAKELLAILASESTTPKVRDVSIKEEVAAVEPKPEAKAEIKPKLASKPKAESEAKVKEKPAPIKASTPVAEKKSSRTGLVIGIVVMVMLALGGIGYGLSTANPPATKAKAAPTKTPKPAVEEAPAATEVVDSFVATEAPFVPVDPMSMLLGADEAESLLRNGISVKGFYQFTNETYSDDQINQFGSDPFPLTLSTYEPLRLGYYYCETTEENRDIVLNATTYSFSIDGVPIPSSKIASFYTDVITEGDSPFCFEATVIFANWIPGTYYIYQQYDVVQTYNVGKGDTNPYTEYRAYILTVP